MCDFDRFKLFKAKQAVGFSQSFTMSSFHLHKFGSGLCYKIRGSYFFTLNGNIIVFNKFVNQICFSATVSFGLKCPNWRRRPSDDLLYVICSLCLIVGVSHIQCEHLFFQKFIVVIIKNIPHANHKCAVTSCSVDLIPTNKRVGIGRELIWLLAFLLVRVGCMRWKLSLQSAYLLDSLLVQCSIAVPPAWTLFVECAIWGQLDCVCVFCWNWSSCVLLDRLKFDGCCCNLIDSC